MKYIYSAVFREDKKTGKVYARVPDLAGCITTGNSLDDAIKQITDAASGWLVVAEDEDMEISPATPQEKLEHKKGEFYSLIRIDTIAYRAQTDTRAIRKNVSLPRWMASLADKRRINCSQVLQEGLLERLS